VKAVLLGLRWQPSSEDYWVGSKELLEDFELVHPRPVKGFVIAFLLGKRMVPVIHEKKVLQMNMSDRSWVPELAPQKSGLAPMRRQLAACWGACEVSSAATVGSLLGERDGDPDT